jgi:hypothetical protein
MIRRFDASSSWLLVAAFVVAQALGGCGVSKRHGDEQASGMGGSAGARSGAGGIASSASAGAPTAGGAPPAVDNPFPCENPARIVDSSTGFVECSNGYRYREKVGHCPILRRPEPVEGGPPDRECSYDADCADDPQGYCRTGYCDHGCVDDSECGTGICACQAGRGLGDCINASCKSDLDCLPGLHCAEIVTGWSDSYFYSYACQTLADTCASDADCPPQAGLGVPNCELGDDGRYCAP